MAALLALPAKLSPPLNDREAINDAIYRAVVGLDTNNADLFNSVLIEDSVLDLNGKLLEGREAVISQCFDFVSKLDTTHFITNTRINIDEGGSTASATANALAQHYRGGQGSDPTASRYLAGSLYWLDLVKSKEDGLWKVKQWKLKVVWAEGDQGVMTGN